MTFAWSRIFRLFIWILFGLLLNLTAGQITEGDGHLGGSEEPAALPVSIPGNVQDTVSAAYGVPNTLIQNDYNMFAAPGTMLRYGTAYGELWNGTTPWGGASFKLPMGIKSVLFFGRPYSGGLFGNYADTFSVGGTTRTIPAVAGTGLVGVTTSGGSIGFIGDFEMVNTPVLSFDILLGKKLAPSVGLGFKYSLYRNKDVDEMVVKNATNTNPDDGKLHNSRLFSEHHFTLGVTLDDFMVFSALDIAADLTLASLDFEYTETMEKDLNFAKNTLVSDGIPSFSLLVRPIFKIGDQSSLVSLVSFSMMDTSSSFERKVDKDNNGVADNRPTDLDSAMVFSDKKTSAVLALAWHTVPAEGFKLIASSGCNFDMRSQKNTGSSWSTNDYTAEMKSFSLQVPVGISLEYAVADFLKLRMGLMKYIIERKTTEGKDSPLRLVGGEKESASLAMQDDANSFRFTMGAGVKVKDLSIDLVVGSTFYNFNTLFTGASLKYHY